MKNLIFSALILSGFLFSGVFARAQASTVFNTDPQDLPTVMVANQTLNPNCSSINCWHSAVSVSAGQTVSVQIYYHNTGNADATNVKIKINRMSDVAVASQGVSATLSADNASSIFGSGTVNISSAQFLSFIPGSVAWYKDQSSYIAPLPFGQDGSEIFTSGINLGTIKSKLSCPPSNSFCHQGTVVLQFKVGSQSNPPIVIGDVIPVGKAPVATTQNANNIDQNRATLNGTIDPRGTNSSTWFEWGTNYSNLNSVINGPGTSVPISIIKNISGLASNSTFYFRVCASNNWGKNCGATLSFVTQGGTQNGLPFVTTNSASSVNQNSATLNGYVNANNSGANTWFEYGSNQNNLYNSIQSGYISGSSSTYAYLNNINYNTTYYFRACASNSYGQICGSINSFTTGNGGNQNGSASATTQNATNVGQNSATLNGYVDGNGSYVTYWFQYGPSFNSLAYTTNSVYQGYGAYNASQSVVNLQPNTNYYFRIVAQNQNGVSHGQIQSFNTNGGNTGNGQLLSISTPAVVISQTMAKVNGLAIDNGSYSVNAWFEYGKTVVLGNSTGSQNLGAISSKAFTEVLSNLEPGTIYYFRAVAQNQNGIVKGDILVFKTTSVANPNPPVNPPTLPANNPAQGSSSSKYISLKIETQFENVSAGDQINYDITYKNISNKNIADAILRVTLPKEVSFDKSSAGSFSDSDNALVVKIDSLKAGEEGKISITGKIGRSVKDQDVLISTAVFVYPNPASQTKENVVAYVLNNVVEKNLLPAASIFGNGGFLPNTLTEWVLLVAGIFGLIFFGRKFYADIKTPKVQA